VSAPAPPPDRPPAGAPPVLLERIYAGERLRVAGDGSGAVGGQPFDDASFRDVVVDAVLSLESGEEGDGYGLFLRQGRPDRYVAVVLSPAGNASIMLLDGGEPLRIAEGPLPGDFPFARGVGAANRLTVLACGPALVPVINGVALTGVILDRRYPAGHAGALLVPSGPGHTCAVGVDWVQVRAVLPDQPASPA